MKLVDITLKCPEDRVADAYANHANWLNRITQLNTDKSVGELFWNDLSPLARDVFALMATNPTRRFESEWIADNLNVPHGRSGVAGVFAWPGRHANKYGMPEYPWCWHNDGIQTFYWMEAEEAEMLRPYAEAWTQTERWQNLNLDLG